MVNKLLSLYFDHQIKTKNSNINSNINSFIRSKEYKKTKIEKKLYPEIIIPCFNQGKYLSEALKSVQFAHLPTTVVNDASTDETSRIVKKLQSKYLFKLISNGRNLNQGGSINKAVESSNNTLFIILNADDVLLKYTISTILSIFNQFNKVRMVGGGSIHFSKPQTLFLNKFFPTKLPYKINPRITDPKDAKKYRNLNDLNMTMSGCTFLKSAWLSVGGFKDFRERICSFDDRDFQLRVSCLYPVAIVDEPLAFYRINSSVGKSQR